ncbi:hypothetical protein MCOR07_009702 [Pyricularia oryzae]|uniref:Uncharacterized protein n=1 Tax=Pyricularia grisea TaxID=148305 RepID=A0ABQ8N9W8_PYRGI|nr:hypothetical protein MCOR26_009876 [Pyricularia oryzae]KAI6293635.1 hypothetical protein MCOR33_009010 [Pyricularia grisea]KAI6333003.1 hypothetical protein MCOR28_010672 [Pyricularia oryzae]KAI6468606.1 hypothetical protein MCOR17_004086 [Pyricularia oryzae]KAI6585919.1 hypothetical protein MCOR12_010080 [Pyricularia oryzae]
MCQCSWGIVMTRKTIGQTGDKKKKRHGPHTQTASEEGIAKPNEGAADGRWQKSGFDVEENRRGEALSKRKDAEAANLVPLLQERKETRKIKKRVKSRQPEKKSLLNTSNNRKRPREQ